MMQLNERDLSRLRGVHPDLIRVVHRAASMSSRKFTVIEGLRTAERQSQLVRQGASKTMNSRHLTGHAVDIAPIDDDGNVSWAWPLYYPLAKVIKEAAEAEGVSIEWGGDWVKFKDGPHWQLPWSKYPAKSGVISADKAKPITEKTEQRAGKERVAEEVIKVAAAASPTIGAFAGIDWKAILAGGFVVIVALAAWRIVPKLMRSDGQ